LKKKKKRKEKKEKERRRRVALLNKYFAIIMFNSNLAAMWIHMRFCKSSMRPVHLTPTPIVISLLRKLAKLNL
jgi:hypothetical protein